MTAASWATLIVAFSVAVILPGPDTFMMLRVGIRDRRSALLAAIGIVIGNAVWTTASLLGLAAVLQAAPDALHALQLLGSLVLLWLGFQSIRSGILAFRAPAAPMTDDGNAVEVEAETTSAVRHPLRLGLLTNLSNPKALLFFAALFSQILPADSGWAERLAILLVLSAIALAWFLAFALLTSSGRFQRWFGRATPIIDLVAGIVFLGVAGIIVVEVATALLAR